MITAGWVGQSAVLVAFIVNKFNLRNKTFEIVILSAFGALWGMLYGIIMNLWFWPFLGAGSGQTFVHSISVIENLERYLAYYLATSIVWDITRTVGNILIISIMAKPVLKIFQRFKLRFSFQNQGEISL